MENRIGEIRLSLLTQEIYFGISEKKSDFEKIIWIKLDVCFSKFLLPMC